MSHKLNTTAFFIFSAAAFAFFTGCGSSGIKTHPVTGKIEVQSGDLKPLAGHTVEIALDTNPDVRAAGQIQDDGSFVLETLHDGAIRPGALPGAYKARIVLGDDDVSKRKLAAKSIPPRYLQFDKSGLSLQVPATENVSLKILRR